MGHEPFSKPVFLKLHRTGNFQAQTAWDAMEYLERHWSAPHSSHYRHALRLCRSAVEGLIGAESARLAVIDAAQRAGLLAYKWEAEGAPVNTGYAAVPASQTVEVA